MTVAKAVESARGGATALVIGEDAEHARVLFNQIVSTPEIQHMLQHNQARADGTNRVIDFWPGKQVRVFTADHPDWDAATQRMRGYPVDIHTYVEVRPKKELPK